MKQMNLKEAFEYMTNKVQDPKHLIVAVKLPTGAIEIIHNTEYLQAKMKYYMEMYDENFALKANPNVEIINFMVV